MVVEEEKMLADLKKEEEKAKAEEEAKRQIELERRRQVEEEKRRKQEEEHRVFEERWVSLDTCLPFDLLQRAVEWRGLLSCVFLD
eukprot:scaffold4170_cov34-Prasinocladus_malaysianus.AAC.1